MVQIIRYLVDDETVAKTNFISHMVQIIRCARI